MNVTDKKWLHSTEQERKGISRKVREGRRKEKSGKGKVLEEGEK
jgi:hypothetical protein